MCPWIDWQPASLKFCEAMICGYIRQPANSISNLSFVICGIMLLRKEKLNTRFNPFHIMGLAAILIGITSGVYHASMTFFWQFFDVSSMFMLILLAVNFNLLRLGWIKSQHFSLTYIISLLTSMGLMLFFQGKSGEWIFAVEVSLSIFLEYLIFRQKKSVDFKSLFQAIGIFLLAFLIWTGDIQGWWCDPDNHYLQGHAIWHILNAVAIWFLYLFYKQFEKNIKI
jgi:hypothetical protein